MRKRRKTSKYLITKRQSMLKWAAAVFLAFFAVNCLFTAGPGEQVKEAPEEVRGVWVSYIDFEQLGLKDKSRTQFIANSEAFLDDASSLGINTVYFHVRPFRDAVYRSQHFPLSRTIWTGQEPMDYDPLAEFIDLAHSRNMEVHGWINPYRNSTSDMDILDPQDSASTEEILLCVTELLDNYELDGIHFDDYFYPEGAGGSEEEKGAAVSAMVKTVYGKVHEYEGAVFGISPAGNVDLCRSIGADVELWLSEAGYVDYIVPQIYWTDMYEASWREEMFTETLDQWLAMNKAQVPVYVGLALYKTGELQENDEGWVSCSNNLSDQVIISREKNCRGYVFYRASDIYRGASQEELKNYLNLVFQT